MPDLAQAALCRTFRPAAARSTRRGWCRHSGEGSSRFLWALDGVRGRLAGRLSPMTGGSLGYARAAGPGHEHRQQASGARSAKFRITHGAADARRITSGCCPAPRRWKRLARHIVRNLRAGDVLDWEVNLILKADEVPRASHGRHDPAGSDRLAPTSKTGTAARMRTRPDLNTIVPPSPGFDGRMVRSSE